MSEFTQGVCADGAAILKDGVMLTVEEIIELLRQGDALMGRGEPVAIGELILPGIDGGEYPDCDIEWHSEIAEKLQEQLVVDDNTVTIPIYIGHPAPAVDDADLRHAVLTAWIWGYEKGHDDTVESRYGCIEEQAKDYVEDQFGEG